MTEERMLQESKKVYKTLCAMLDERKIEYDKTDDLLSVVFTMYGDDMPIRICIEIDKDAASIFYHSAIPFVVPKDKYLDFAIATSQINYRLANGSFMFELIMGLVFYKVTSCFMDCLVSKAMLEHLLGVLCHTVDEYNDKFLMLAKGKLTLKKFLSEINQ